MNGDPDRPGTGIPRALAAIHDAVWQMRGSGDIAQVMAVLQEQLRHLGVVYQALVVNIIDRQTGEVVARRRTLALPGQTQGWISIDGIPAEDATGAIVRFWRAGATAYRPDLHHHDPYGERAWADHHPGQAVRCVLDVPFSHGTLSLNSPQPDAFSTADVYTLEGVAALLSDGFRRLDDLRALERQAQAAGEEMRLNLSLQQVRNQILRMEEAADWEQVVRALQRELSSLVDFWFCSIQFIDQQAGTFSYYSTVFAPEHWQFQGQEQLPLTPSLKKVVATGQVLYRRTRAEVEAYQDQVKAEAASIVDVPFAGGTLAMNSTREHAFGERDIEVLERFAQVVSEGYQRLLDLRRLAQIQQQLQQAQRLQAVGQLAAGIAHNFNNLLQVVVANLNLAMLQAPPSQQYCLQEADAAAMRGGELVRQLMLYARGDAGSFTPRPLALRPLVEQAVSLCRETIDRRFSLEVDLPADLPLVLAEAGQLEQVLLNLYLNARDALEEGEQPLPWIRTDARLVERAAPAAAEIRHYVELRVSDNGAGMSPATRERIFEPFFTTKEVGKGTGLGLASAYGILQRHGGWIECESQPGVGTCFSLYLPVATAPATAPENQESPELQRGTETLLLIDDDAAVRRSAAELLLAQGYEVLEAGDGHRGLELAKRHQERLRLVLLDLSMPQLSGREVLRQLRLAYPRLPVILFTGYTSDWIPMAGAAAVVEKPFAVRSLVALVRRVLDA